MYVIERMYVAGFWELAIPQYFEEEYLAKMFVSYFNREGAPTENWKLRVTKLRLTEPPEVKDLTGFSLSADNLNGG